MGLLDTIIGGGVSSIIKGAADVVDRFIQTPEEKTRALKELREIEAKETEALLQATSSVIKEEAGSDDPWVRRARPTFLYIMYGVIVFNFVLVPIAHMSSQAFFGMTLSPLPIPEEIYWLFGSGYLGYAGARSWDKRKG